MLIRHLKLVQVGFQWQRLLLLQPLRLLHGDLRFLTAKYARREAKKTNINAMALDQLEIDSPNEDKKKVEKEMTFFDPFVGSRTRKA